MSREQYGGQPRVSFNGAEVDLNNSRAVYTAVKDLPEDYDIQTHREELGAIKAVTKAFAMNLFERSRVGRDTYPVAERAARLGLEAAEFLLNIGRETEFDPTGRDSQDKDGNLRFASHFASWAASTYRFLAVNAHKNNREGNPEELEALAERCSQLCMAINTFLDDPEDMFREELEIAEFCFRLIGDSEISSDNIERLNTVLLIGYRSLRAADDLILLRGGQIKDTAKNYQAYLQRSFDLFQNNIVNIQNLVSSNVQSVNFSKPYNAFIARRSTIILIEWMTRIEIKKNTLVFRNESEAAAKAALNRLLTAGMTYLFNILELHRKAIKTDALLKDKIAFSLIHFGMFKQELDRLERLIHEVGQTGDNLEDYNVFFTKMQLKLNTILDNLKTPQATGRGDGGRRRRRSKRK